MKKQEKTMQYSRQGHGVIFSRAENLGGGISISVFSAFNPKGKYFLFND